MMGEQRNQDEALLIDYLLGRCDEATGRAVDLRLEKDADFQALRGDMKNTLDALDLLSAPDVPDDLADRTLARIASARQSTAVRTQKQLVSSSRPTFSLRELGTIAAAAIIMALLFIPWARQVRSRSLQSQCASNVGQVGTGMKNFAMNNQDSLPLAHASNAAWLPGGGGKPVVSNSAGLFHLVSGHYAPAGVFQCAADPSAAGEAFGVNVDMTDFPAAKYISYSYQHALGAKSLLRASSALAPVAGEMAVLSDKTPVFEDGRFQAEFLSRPQTSSRNHGRRGHNVLYLDWGVKWRDRATVGVNGDNIFLVQGKEEYDGTETPANETDTFLLPAWSGKTDTRE
ncbi:MAG: hypothetical protein QGG42_21310 [Phycisphaerae bacterium]|jgi:hypothetical protein|nr:hypothetical protein [Phycisphaerae bacterium]